MIYKESETFLQIRKILRDEWNPIGFDEDLPQDEYDSYIPTIIFILKSKRKYKHYRIRIMLKHLEFNHIGLMPKTLYWLIRRNIKIYFIVKKIVDIKI